jgi:hypothetical protein
VVDALKDQMALQDQAAVALAAEEPAEEGSDMDELDWEWDVYGSGSSEAEIRDELQYILCGVVMAEAGFSSCADCARLLVRSAQELVAEMEDSRPPLQLTDPYREAWDRSRLLVDMIITAESWAAALDSTPRCASCASCAACAGVLTAAGEEAGRVAAIGAAECKTIAWLQRRKWPERARTADIWKHGTFHWDANRQGLVLVSLPSWLGDLDAAQRCLMQVTRCRMYSAYHAHARARAASLL